MRTPPDWGRVAVGWFAALLLTGPARSDSPSEVRFNRDIRPVLADHCYQCHGPDKARRKADLRLDTEDGVRAVVVAGKPGQSELVRRVGSHDAEERMPPKAGRPLSPR